MNLCLIAGIVIDVNVTSCTSPSCSGEFYAGLL